MNNHYSVKKRGLSVFLCFIMVLTIMLVPISAGAQEVDKEDTGFMSGQEDEYPFAMVNGVKYTLLENHCLVTGYDYDDVRENIVIEKEVEGLPVTYIWGHAFYHNLKIKSVYIPNTITGADVSAFQDCSNLKTVEFEENSKFTHTFEWCFSGCTSLESINFPSSLEVLGQFIFEDCINLKSVTFDNNSKLRCIAGEAFIGCELLETIDIPASTKEIDERAFENCYSLRKVDLHEGLEKIGEKAFLNCYSLPEIYVPESVEEIGAYALACFEYEGDIYSYTEFVVTGSYESLADEYAKAYQVTYEHGLSAPTLTAISNTASGIKISFSKIPNVSGKYRVYRKTAGTSWKALGDVTSNTFTDKTAVAGTKYTYTVKFLGYDGTTSRYSKDGISITRMTNPAVTKIENTTDGAKITWGAVAGATKYRVYYKTSNGWKSIGNRTSTSIVHTDAVPNTSYTYTVKAFDSDGATSSFNSTGWTNKFIATPKITSVTNAQNGAKITWDKVAGAENYRVFVKNGSSWKGLGNTTSNSFTYTGALSGIEQTYTVRCMSKDSKKATSGYDKEGFTYTYLAAPKVSKITNTTDGVKLSWPEVNGASKYRVYVKTASSWKSIGDTTDNFFVHSDAVSNTSYTYTLKAFDENGKSSSFISKGFTNKFIATPKISSVSNTINSVKITWGKVDGAVNYRVFVKTATGWKGLGNTTSTTFNHTGVTSGTQYTYTVRCMTKDGKTAVSDYDKTGKSYTFLSRASITKIENTVDGAKITIGKVQGATKYRVYIRANGTWKSIGETETTTFIHADAVSGTKYTYTVKAFKDNEASGIHNSTGWNNTFVASPVITELSADDNGVTITWDKVQGAPKYRVFIKTESGWKRLADTTSTSYLHKDVVEGEIYTYTVRCLSSDGKKFLSGYDKDGEWIFYEM